jgi:hypothetical protein
LAELRNVLLLPFIIFLASHRCLCLGLLVCPPLRHARAVSAESKAQQAFLHVKPRVQKIIKGSRSIGEEAKKRASFLLFVSVFQNYKMLYDVLRCYKIVLDAMMSVA